MNPQFPTDFIWGAASQEHHVTVRDIEQMSYLGVKVYRFSIAWSDFSHQSYYDDIIAACAHFGITPVVSVGDDFDDRDDLQAFIKNAEYLFKRYPAVKHWIILPNRNIRMLKGTLDQRRFQMAHQTILTYAKVVICLKDINKEAQAGCGVDYIPAYAIDDVPENAIAKLSFDDTLNHYWLDAYLFGRYPRSSFTYLSKKGYAPKITRRDQALLKKAASLTDFIALSYHQSVAVGFNPLSGIDSFTLDKRQYLGVPGLYRTHFNSYLTDTKGQKNDPVGLRYALKELTSRYDLPILVTNHSLNVAESTNEMMLHDPYRIDFLREHLKQVRSACEEGARLIGYCAALVDDEPQHNGLIYAAGDRRVLKDSYFWYKHIIETNGCDL